MKDNKKARGSKHHKNLTVEEVKNIRCPYCGSQAVFMDSELIYGKNLGKMYVCSNYPKCDSYVGVHKGTNIPKGSMANGLLREYRKEVHGIVDPFWRNGIMDRGQFYAWMAEQLQIPAAEAHVGMFDVERCKKAIGVFGENQILNLPKQALDTMFEKYFACSENYSYLLESYEKDFMPKMRKINQRGETLTGRQQYYAFKCYKKLMAKIRSAEKSKMAA